MHGIALHAASHGAQARFTTHTTHSASRTGGGKQQECNVRHDIKRRNLARAYHCPFHYLLSILPTPTNATNHCHYPLLPL